MPEKINITEYGYSQDAKVEISGSFLLALLNFTGEIIFKESHSAHLFELPVVKDGKIDYELANNLDFFQQPEQKVLTVTGVKAMDMQYMLEALHYEAITNNIAKKNSELLEEAPGNFKI